LRGHASYVITRSAELPALAAFRDFIARTGKQIGIDEKTVFDLQLAVDEAATNVIQHGYAGMNPGSLMLEVHPHRSDLQLVLTDFGHPFEPIDPGAPDVDALLESRPTGGFGLYFIYQAMDDVEYYSDEEGNHLVLVKKL
jgi:serine/threonine-protein kinase RsbW